MFEEKTEIDMVEIVKFSLIQVRKVNMVLKNGQVIASSFSRIGYNFGDDISGEDDRIKAIAQVIWADKYAAASTQAVPESDTEAKE